MARNKHRRDIKETIFDDKFRARNWGSRFGPHYFDSDWLPHVHKKNLANQMPRYADVIKDNVTLFIGNLPEDMDSEWLSQLFSSSGQVFASIPNKRSYMHNDRFGFVKFAKKEEGLKAIRCINGMLIRGHHLLVKFARFSNYSGEKLQRNFNRTTIDHFWKPKLSSILQPPYPTYPKKTVPTIKVMEVGNEWLSRSVVAKIYPDRSLVSIQEHLQSLRCVNVEAKPMGGDTVVLTFNSVAERESLFSDGDLAWLRECFVEVHKWEDSKHMPRSSWCWLFQLPNFTQGSAQ